MYFTYTFLLTAGLLLAFPVYLIRFRKYMPTLAGRLGFLKIPPQRNSIWVHAVSVGEVKSVEKLIERLRLQFPGSPVVVSTTTPRGQELARQRTDIIDHTIYFPLDLPWCVRRTLDCVDPQMAIIAETEIWPNFLRACRRRNIPVVMINGRISDRSFPRYKLLRRWLPRVFADYTMLGMQSEIDRRRIEEIGAPQEKVAVLGNLKYDVDASSRPVDETLAALLRSWTAIWIAASTMPGEEEPVLDAFAVVRKQFTDLKLVMAPRHPERCGEVEALLRRRGFRFVKRTALILPSPGAGDGLILDTIGELAGLFQFATVVFVGGSLVPRGGHNVLEPARYAKPIIFGPHMYNFRDITRVFLASGAAIQIQNSSDLAAAVSKVLSDARFATDLGRKARRIVDENVGATERVLQVVEGL